MGEHRYEMRIVSGYDYSSHADVGYLYFKSGVTSTFSPAGHSEKRLIGETVVCRLEKGVGRDGKPGYFFEGLAVVLGFSSDGRPNKFGRTLSNKGVGRWWEYPTETDKIYDERENPQQGLDKYL